MAAATDRLAEFRAERDPAARRRLAREIGLECGFDLADPRVRAMFRTMRPVLIGIRNAYYSEMYRRRFAPTRCGARSREHRPAARRRAGASSRTSSADPGDDGPGRSPRAAQTRGGVYSYGCERCEACDRVLVWHSGQLVCCHKPCPFWGRPV